MGIFKLRPAQPESVVVSDLDRLIREPVSFRLHGRVHEIKPITTEQFLKLADGLGKLDELKARAMRGERIDERELVEKYHSLFRIACDSLTKEDFMKMQHSQRSALFQIILRACDGTAHIEAEKKNVTQTEQTPKSSA